MPKLGGELSVQRDALCGRRDERRPICGDMLGYTDWNKVLDGGVPLGGHPFAWLSAWGWPAGRAPATKRTRIITTRDTKRLTAERLFRALLMVVQDAQQSAGVGV